MNQQTDSGHMVLDGVEMRLRDWRREYARVIEPMVTPQALAKVQPVLPSLRVESTPRDDAPMWHLAIAITLVAVLACMAIVFYSTGAR